MNIVNITTNKDIRIVDNKVDVNKNGLIVDDKLFWDKIVYLYEWMNECFINNN